ncbi:GTP 3',8-cyclase MoaA [Aestuariicella hydrocarbonica]|uniref:GTP 3',8-cyclase n=1 Tax=Pseudomaricurvus hydrocarbonicus TaxID=1470433 RepID=A0A9E5JS44_9GAMM|nr:GTP 3',8-cyclase MoaA [Aestuariicella hydrocarbonica]NHO65802.1 GTP 3',8-cyclase MoaA [Aestuariicella hydrocarbonica]
MKLTDPFGRHITYLRLSVTDRCNYRCVYCMSEDMTFLPRAQLLSLEECAQISAAFVDMGVKKIRITGGEPLIRRDIASLFQQLGRLPSLDELTLTTNGTHLPYHASDLAAAGVRRINISLDTLCANQFHEITRTGSLDDVFCGIDAARQAGIETIKLNAVILRHRNLNQVIPLLQFALRESLDISFIEEMPLGAVVDHQRETEFCSSAELRALMAEHYELQPTTINTGGPSRYWRVDGSLSRVGFISPHSDNFCGDCNRVRVTAEGKLLLCLGNEDAVDLKALIRRYPGDRERLKQTIVDALALKPEKHHFYENDQPQIIRFMNATGG